MSDSWIDVAAHPSGGFVRAISRQGQVEIIGAAAAGHWVVPTDWLRYLRVAVSPAGHVAVIGQGGEGLAWLIVDWGTPRSLGQTYGMNPVAVRYDGETLHTFRCGQGDGVPLYVDDVEVMRTRQVEGIRDVLPDGTIVLGQPTAAGVFNGRNFGQFTRRDGWIVGQSGYSIGCLHEATSHYFTARRGTMAEGIHFSLQSTGELAVCALTEAGAYYEVFAPPFPPNEPLVDVPPPPPPPPPPEDPVPAVPIAEIARAKETLARVRTELNFGPNMPSLPYVRDVALRLGGAWGLNGKRGDRNDPSGDVLAWDWPDVQPQLYDVLIDAGRKNGATFAQKPYPQVHGAVWLSPGGTTPPPPEDEPKPPPKPAGPSLHVWTIVEFPQVAQARRDGLGQSDWQPEPAWVILQMARRYGFGLPPGEAAWTLAAMIAHESNV